MLIDTCGMAASPCLLRRYSAIEGFVTLLLVLSEAKRLPAPSLLVGGEQRADIFHRPLQPAFDLRRDLPQLVVLPLEPRQALRQFLGAGVLVVQALLDHRLQPAERTVHSLFGTRCLGHCSPPGGSGFANLRLIYRGMISLTLAHGEHIGTLSGESPLYLCPASPFEH